MNSTINLRKADSYSQTLANQAVAANSSSPNLLTYAICCAAQGLFWAGCLAFLVVHH